MTTTDTNGLLGRNSHMEMTWRKGLEELAPSTAQLEHGLELHRSSIVIDTFGFMPKVWTPELVETMNGWIDAGMGAKEHAHKATVLRIHAMSRAAEGRQEFIAALKAAGVTGVVQTVGGGENLEYTLDNMAGHRHLCHCFREHLFQATTATELREAKAQGRTGMIWSVNGPPPMGDMADPDDKLYWLQTWYHLGVRLMHLSYNRRNFVADGCTEDADAGLSDFGRETVKKMNEVGIIVDTPHSGRATTLEAARLSTKPMMASHIGCKVLHDHPRCKTDEELKAIAATGGMIGIFSLPSLLGPNAGINLMLDHLAHAVKTIGTDHVGLGTDCNYMLLWPKELKAHPARTRLHDRAGGWKPAHRANLANAHLDGGLAWTNWPLFTVGLVMRGHSDGDIQKILGANLMRVLEANRPAHEVDRQR